MCIFFEWLREVVQIEKYHMTLWISIGDREFILINRCIALALHHSDHHVVYSVLNVAFFRPLLHEDIVEAGFINECLRLLCDPFILDDIVEA